MGSLRPLRAIVSQYRKRKQLATDGGVPGIQYNRYHRGYTPVVAPVENRAPGGAPRDYMSLHADAYEPHPGEAVAPDVFYSPYRAEVSHRAPDALDAPAAGLQSDADQAEHVDTLIERAIAGWLMRRFVNDLPNRPAPEAIPEDHDVLLGGSIGPTIDQPVDPPGNGAAINDVWDRVLNRPEYGSLPMTHDLFDQAMGDVAHTADTLESVPDKRGPINDCWFPMFEDQIAARDDGLSPEEMGEGYPDIDSLGMAADIIHEPDIHADVDPDEAQDPGFPDADPFDNGLDMQDVGPLEQIAEELAPPVPEPDPVMDKKLYEDELLMNPWMMPGMGPMPPGLGPMGPMPPGF